MPDNQRETVITHHAAADRGYPPPPQSPGGQEEFIRILSALLEQARHTHPPQTPLPAPEVLEAVESVKVTTRRLAKPGTQPLPFGSRWSLPPLNIHLTTGSGYQSGLK